MKTSPKGPLLPAVHDDNLMISHSEIEDGLEMANYFPLPFGLTPQENLLQSIWKNRSAILIYQSMC